MSQTAKPLLPFDAFRVSGRDAFGFAVTRVEVREIHKSSGWALVGCGRNLHSEIMVRFDELFSDEEKALVNIRARLRDLTYQTAVFPKSLPANV